MSLPVPLAATPASPPGVLRRRPGRRPGGVEGAALAELLIVLAVLAATAALAVPRAVRFVDRTAVHVAVDAIASACALARGAAIMRGAFVTVTIDTQLPAVRVTTGADTLLERRLDLGGPLRLSASRSHVVYDRVGLGFGASNTTVVARQGSAADTLYTSRLGRVRH